ncbi:MAG: hypothetical protein AAF415_20995 [Pseudomonadota bacterium]
MSVTFFETDTDDQFIWNTRETTFDDVGDGALLLSRLVELDNGVVRNEGYTDGSLTSLSVEDQSTNGSALPLERMELNFDPGGTLLTRDRFFDDSVVVREEFVNDGSVSVRLTKEDPDDTRPFAYIEETYDQSGHLSIRRVLNDDGLYVERAFSAGVVTAERKLDFSADGSAAPFSSIETVFRPDGSIFNQDAELDHGGSIYQFVSTDNGESDFRPGQFEIVRYSGNKDTNWARIHEIFEEDGTILSQSIANKSGPPSVKRAFTEGVLTEIVKRDGQGPFFPDVTPYETRIERFDAAGELIFSSVSLDDGNVFEKEFEDGVLIRRVTRDVNDSSPWGAREEVFDPMTGELETLTYSSDENAFLFCPRKRTAD